MNQVTVPALDVAASITFYERLGLQLIVHSGPDYARFVCPDGEATFSLHRVDSLPGPNGVVVYFECDDLDATLARVQRAGLVLESGPVEKPWLWREATVRDPANNQLCLFHAGKNRTNPPWRLPGAP
jgi:predicted enzyme related to lactoylglutathione lyase